MFYCSGAGNAALVSRVRSKGVLAESIINEDLKKCRFLKWNDESDDAVVSRKNILLHFVLGLYFVRCK